MRSHAFLAVLLLFPAAATARHPAQAGPDTPEPPAGEPLPLPESPVPGVRLVVGGDAMIGGFPAVLRGEAGGAADYTALRLGVELPLGILRITPEAGGGLSLLVRRTGCFEAFGGLRLSVALPVRPFVFAHAGYGSWEARVFDPVGPYDIDGYSEVVHHDGPALRGGGGFLVKLFRGQVQAGLQLVVTRYPGGSTTFDDSVSSGERSRLGRIGWISGGIVVEMAP